MSSEAKVGYRAVDGLQIRYADSDGPASQHLVLTSPWPESLHAFDPIWPRLSGTARLLAIDLPGFGRSERRTDLLSPMAMSGFLVQILDEWDIADPHLVCPGVGTPAGLFAAARHPGRIRSLVIGGGAAAWPLQVDGTLKEMIDAPDTGVVRSQDRFAEAARYVRSYPEQLPLLAGLLPQIFTPVQIITGRNDPIVPVADAEFLYARLPNSRLDVLGTGHLAWEEAPGEYGAIIAAWVNGGYLTGNTGMNLM
jgi:pimeloyl-ACP methyl ester carboxylesterase